MEAKRYILAGGGTSGHVNPALAIADQLMLENPEHEILFCGTARGIEKELAERAGYRFEAIPARPLPRRLTPDLLPALFDYLDGRRQSRRIMQRFQPHAVVGTGGYVCSPVVAAAASLHIPILLHEQNAFPGRSNRLMARRSQAVCIAFEAARRWFARQVPITVTGNPVRPVFFSQEQAAARQAMGMDQASFLILAMGGSLGARTINQAILGLDSWMQARKAAGGQPIQVILAAGTRQFEETAARAGAGMGWLTVRPYIHDIHLAMAAANLLIGRSGAITCSEIAALGKPSLLVPYPYAAGDHQTHNARVLASAGAALLCPDDQMTAAWLAGQLESLLGEPGRLAAMGAAAAGLARPDAAAAICRCLHDIEL